MVKAWLWKVVEDEGGLDPEEFQSGTDGFDKAGGLVVKWLFIHR